MKKGFTLVELVIVIAVIAILAGVLIPTFGGIIKKANASAALQEAQNTWKEAYALDLSDGELNGKDGTTDLTKDEEDEATGYNADGTFEAVINGYEVTYKEDASNKLVWTAKEHTHVFADPAATTGTCTKCGETVQ